MKLLLLLITAIGLSSCAMFKGDAERKKELKAIEARLSEKVDKKIELAISKIEGLEKAQKDEIMMSVKEDNKESLDTYKMQIREAIASELAGLSVGLEDKIKEELKNPAFLPELEILVVEKLKERISGEVKAQHDADRAKLIKSISTDVLKKVLDTKMAKSRLKEVKTE